MIHAVVLPALTRLRQPLVTAGGTYRDRPGFILELRDGARRLGRGEATPLPSFGTETLEQCEAKLEAVRGHAWQRPDSLFAVAAALDAMDLAGAPAARHAVECALLEWLAVERGVPVAELLSDPAGRKPRPAIAVNALIGSGAAAIEAARRAVDEGFRTLKVKVAAGGDDVAAIRAIRAEVGDGIRIRIDANGKWSREEAVAALIVLAPLRIELCEQPVAAEDVDGLDWVRTRSPVAIAADEALGIPEQLDAVLERVDTLVLKPMVLGGPLRTIAVAGRARQENVRVYVTSSIEGPLGRMAAVHVAAVLDMGLAHGLSVGTLVHETPDELPLQPRGGVIEVPSGPGWGFQP